MVPSRKVPAQVAAVFWISSVAAQPRTTSRAKARLGRFSYRFGKLP
jgi:hypothetical protein